MFHTQDTVVRPDGRVVFCGVIVGLAVLGCTVAAAGPDDAYETQLDALQERINAAQSGEVPSELPTAKEIELQEQITAMEIRVARAETDLASCKVELILAKER